MITLLALALIITGLTTAAVITVHATRRHRADYAGMRAELGHDTRTAA